jgi:hypothetical protein
MMVAICYRGCLAALIQPKSCAYLSPRTILPTRIPKNSLGFSLKAAILFQSGAIISTFPWILRNSTSILSTNTAVSRPQEGKCAR